MGVNTLSALRVWRGATWPARVSLWASSWAERLSLARIITSRPCSRAMSVASSSRSMVWVIPPLPGQDRQWGFVLRQYRVGVRIRAVARLGLGREGGDRRAGSELLGQLRNRQLIEQVNVGGKNPFLFIERNKPLTTEGLLNAVSGRIDQPRL